MKDTTKNVVIAALLALPIGGVVGVNYGQHHPDLKHVGEALTDVRSITPALPAASTSPAEAGK